jgi:cupin superfamily acireductone dioxygenase involved in methionine salvage
MEGYIEYTRREYCKDVRCPIQVLLDREVEKSPKYEEIRAICASDCLHTTHEFHHWLTGKGYLVVRPKQQ